MEHDDGFDLSENTKHPRVYIQWKNTFVCIDFYCDCGASCHFDGDFCYTVKCPHCGTVWEMPQILFPRKAGPHTNRHWKDNPNILQPDQRMLDQDGCMLIRLTPTGARD